MKTILLWLGVLLLFTITACKKENRETTIDGRVITYGTETKATNTPLRMGLYRATSAGIFQSGEELVQETLTDTNGNYHFTFKPDGSLNYYLRLLTREVARHKIEDGYALQLGYPQQLSGKKQKIDFVLYPQAWLKLHFINNGPYFPGDKIRFSLGGGQFFEYYGPVDREDIYKSTGNISFTLYYAVTRNNVVTGFETTIPFIMAFDTTYHLIEY